MVIFFLRGHVFTFVVDTSCMGNYCVLNTYYVLYFTYIPYTHIQHKDYTYKALKRYKRLNAAIQKYT